MEVQVQMEEKSGKAEIEGLSVHDIGVLVIVVHLLCVRLKVDKTLLFHAYRELTFSLLSSLVIDFVCVCARACAYFFVYEGKH